MSRAAPAVSDLAATAIQWVAADGEQAWNAAALSNGPVVQSQLRLWRYREPAVVLGRSQRALAVRGVDLPLINREAGGGAVLVGPWMLSLSVVLAPDHPLVLRRSLSDSYEWLGAVLVAALREVGVAARAARSEDARAPPPGLEWACFAGITRHETLVGRRKIVGLAQRRTRRGVLLVGGILLDPVPWSLLAANVLRDPLQVSAAAAGLAAETISLAESLTEPLTEPRPESRADRRAETGLGASAIAPLATAIATGVAKAIAVASRP